MILSQLDQKSKSQDNQKIKELDDLADILDSHRNRGEKIVLCHGVFDLLHVGHIYHFEEAKKMGDVLVVTITPDHHVNKGPHRPAFPQALRAQVIAALGVVDYVAINQWPTAIDTVKLLKPHVYAKGPDYQDASKDVTGNIALEAEAVQLAGGEIRCTQGVTFSTSNLLNRHWSLFPPETSTFLEAFRKRYSLQDIRQNLDSLRSLKVLVIGETILDEYVYGDTIGKSAKEPVLAMRYISKDIHAGGVLAIANHIADFCDDVKVVSYLGKINPREEFVRAQLKDNVKPDFIYKADSPTIVKRRYVEKYTVSKLLEIYEMNDELLNEEEDRQFCDLLEKRLDQCDVAIVADYGHGFISPRAAEILSAKAKFLAVNTQINAANIGFHTISKYRRADYVCIHEGEIRLDYRNRKEDLKKLTTDLVSRLDCQLVMVTLGKRGTLLHHATQGFSHCPAFADKVIDRIGAGDSVLALTSLCAARDLPPDVTGFVGNLAAAQAVMIVGNKSSISRVQLFKSIESMLK